MPVSTPTLSELRSQLKQLLVREDRLLAEYQCVHGECHILQRKGRTTHEFDNHIMALKERLLEARLKLLGIRIRNVGGRRRELLEEILNMEKAETAAARAKKVNKVMKDDVGSAEAEAAVAP